MVYKELELLIKNNRINMDKNNFYIIDNHNKIFKYREMKQGFIFEDMKDDRYDIHFYYSEEELATDINVNIFDISTYEPQYKKDLLHMIEKKYFELDLAIDNSQGCMDDLSYHFDELNYYKQVIQYLGGDIEADREKIWKELQEDYDKSEELRVKRVPISASLFMNDKINDEDLKSTLIHIILKLNELEDK